MANLERGENQKENVLKQKLAGAWKDLDLQLCLKIITTPLRLFYESLNFCRKDIYPSFKLILPKAFLVPKIMHPSGWSGWHNIKCLLIPIELIDIEGSRREILEAFWNSPYLNITYCIDLKIGTWLNHFRKRNIITRAENTILSSEQH